MFDLPPELLPLFYGFFFFVFISFAFVIGMGIFDEPDLSSRNRSSGLRDDERLCSRCLHVCTVGSELSKEIICVRCLK